MPKLKKQIQLRDLANIRTWVTDSNPFSDYFRLTQVPDVVPGGKSGFLINGSPLLVRSTEILVELVDADGNPIYTSPIKNYQEGMARVVGFEVYEDAAPGPATLTILGEVAYNKDGTRTPNDWIGTYNVKWQKIVNIEPGKPNTSVIRLYNKPNLSVYEQLIPYRQVTTGSTISISSGTLSAQYIEGNVQLVGDDITKLQRVVTPAATQITADQPIFNRYTIGGQFTASIDGNIFTSSIASVQSDMVAKLNNYYVSGTAALSRWSTNAYSMSYQLASTYTTQSLNRSFANIKLGNLTTFTGDIQRAKIYIRGADQKNQKYELFEDVLLEAHELTISQSYTGEQVELGEIIDQPFLNTNWSAGLIANSNYYLPTGSIVATYDATVLMDSAYLAGNGMGTITSSYSAVPLAWMGISQSMNFTANAEYTFTADIVCIKPTDTFIARMDVYLYGPAFAGGTGNELGKRIASFLVPEGKRKNFYGFSTNFEPPADDTAVLRFVVYGGDWSVSKAKILSSRETGFNPDEITIYSPVVNRRFEHVQFKAELYDANSNMVPLLIETDPLYFDGGNLVFRGGDTRIDGLLTVAPSGSGPTLTTKGFKNKLGVLVEGGQAISIGPPIPQIKNRSTAFFAGTGSAGPEISVGDKLHGYINQSTNEFVLEIEGTLLVGSGSNKVDIRKLIPGQSSYGNFTMASGTYADFQEVRARRAFLAGTETSEIGRFGQYSRVTGPTFVGSASMANALTSSYNPFLTGSSVMIISGVIVLNPTQSIINDTLYGNFTLDISASSITDGTYVMSYDLSTATQWGSYPPDSGSSYTSVVNGSNYYVISPSNFSPNPTIRYPIYVPAVRGANNTLYWKVNLTTYATPSF